MKKKELWLIFFLAIEHNRKWRVLNQNPYVSGQRKEPHSFRKAKRGFWIRLPGTVSCCQLLFSTVGKNEREATYFCIGTFFAVGVILKCAIGCAPHPNPQDSTATACSCDLLRRGCTSPVEGVRMPASCIPGGWLVRIQLGIRTVDYWVPIRWRFYWLLQLYSSCRFFLLWMHFLLESEFSSTDNPLLMWRHFQNFGPERPKNTTDGGF